MKLGFYAYDVGPASNLAALAKVFAGEAVIAPPQQPGAALALLPRFNECDALVVGLASFQTEQELDLIERLRPEVPVFVYEDVPGTCSRPKVRDRGLFGRFAAVLSALPGVYWRDETLKLGYRHAVYLGPPVHWGRLYAAMTSPRVATLREQLFAPVAPVFFFAGIKNPEVVNDILEALAPVLRHCRGRLAFRPHPGEEPREPLPLPTDASEDLKVIHRREAKRYREEKEHYDRALSRRRDLLAEVPTVDVDGVIARGEASFSEIAAAANVPVFTGGATDSIIAAYARVAAIYYDYPEAAENLRRQCLIGDGRWFVPELGGSYRASSSDELRDAAERILAGAGELRQSQEQNFPIPATWDSASAALDFIAARTGLGG